jgi:beta-glucosidase
MSFGPPEKLTIFEAIKKKVPATSRVTSAEGANFENVTDIENAIEMAKSADVIVLCIGELPSTETVGNIDNLMISDSQIQLSSRLAALNKTVIVVYIGGRPRVITSIAQNAKAVLVSFLPGFFLTKIYSSFLYALSVKLPKLALIYFNVFRFIREIYSNKDA